jgi:prepilin-type N-terminal cleavage/methylation domain-containing protein
MKQQTYRTLRRRGFTLIEMLVVIAVMSVLASMIFPITKAVNRTKLRSRARADMAQLETAIQSYKMKLGFYPPDNKNTNSPINQLYYELLGTTAIGGSTKLGAYQTLDGSSTVDGADAGTAFGVDGFANATKGGGDEGQLAINFYKGLNSTQIGEYKTGQMKSPVRVLVGPAVWPDRLPPLVPGNAATRGLNPWHYNSSNPAYNPGSYDLWIDLIIDGKTNRIGNWSREPLINPPR